MIIGGWQRSSLIDYPGKISCVLFLSGCNFKCPFCHNPDLAKGTPAIVLDRRRVYDFLAQRAGLLDAVVLSGGEPTLNKDLVFFCERIKKMGYLLKLDTNGSRPQMIQSLLEKGLVDYIAMDIKTDPFNYEPLIWQNSNSSKILSSIQIIMQSAIPYEFRTTCLRPLVNETSIKSILHCIKGAMLYALQRFQKNILVLDPEFCQENACQYDDIELMHLKSVAEPFVKKCIVR
jgi:pyruvate formate lyase activating enzyme